MVLFPNCKINIGLDILRRRDDGFHEIETLMYPVGGLCDILEIVPADGMHGGALFTSSGLGVDCPAGKNLCVKAYELTRERYGLGGVKIHLHKIIPFGAGLGGGSADASFVIKGLDRLFRLGLSCGEMEELAGSLGSDTPFFINNTPVIAKGRGEIMETFDMGVLAGKLLIIVKPPFGVSTAEAYSGIEPSVPDVPLAERLEAKPENWKKNIFNGFEPHIFKKYPELALIKDILYANGAVYASMSGSGSAVFGIFDAPEDVLPDNAGASISGWEQPVCEVLRAELPGLYIYQGIMG